MEGYGNHIVQYSPEYSLCAGCDACSIVCGLTHEGYVSHGNSRIKVKHGTRSMIHTILSCQQCLDRPCYDACPKKDQAMRIDESSGVVYIVEDDCIGCGKCMKACKFEPSRISMKLAAKRKEWKAVKCDLCRTNPEGPQCIKYCQVVCLGLSDESAIFDDGTLAPEALKKLSDAQLVNSKEV